MNKNQKPLHSFQDYAAMISNRGPKLIDKTCEQQKQIIFTSPIKSFKISTNLIESELRRLIGFRNQLFLCRCYTEIHKNFTCANFFSNFSELDFVLQIFFAKK